MRAEAGQGATAAGLQAAALFGVDLSAHRARRLTAALAAEAGQLVVFEAWQRQAVLALAPDAAVVLLGEVDGAPGEPIADPFGGDAATYAASYGRIRQAVAALRAARLPAPAHPGRSTR